MEDKTGPTLTDKARRDAEERHRRQAEALRANLARRKARSRAIAEAPPSEIAPDTPDAP